jgi:hypothetical protein
MKIRFGDMWAKIKKPNRIRAKANEAGRNLRARWQDAFSMGKDKPTARGNRRVGWQTDGATNGAMVTQGLIALSAVIHFLMTMEAEPETLVSNHRTIEKLSE